MFIKGLNRDTDSKVLLYINDRETYIRDRHELNSRSGVTEQFWASKIGDHKYILDIKMKPLELYVQEDLLNVIGYQKKKVVSDGQKHNKDRYNEYCRTRKSAYSEQIYLPCEEYLIMNNIEVITMVKVSLSSKFE